VSLIYPASRHALYGEPESCKGWFVIAACADAIMLGGHALYIDFEDIAATAVERLRAVGIPGDLIGAQFHYVRPTSRSRKPRSTCW
jgi:hypothetical protein